MWGRIGLAALAGGLALAGSGAWAAEGIYTCVDAKGKRWTSDRYIAECTDREQKLVGPTGTLRAVVPPTLTAKEREEKDLADKKLAEEAQKRNEEKRMQRALLSRYPNRASHDLDRSKALQSVDDSARLAEHAIEDLRKQRAELAKEAEFFKDASKMPAKLRRQLEENDNAIAAQQRFVANQDEERKRVNARFEDELVALKKLWMPAGVAAAEPPATAPIKR
jgi:hypothetical protein